MKRSELAQVLRDAGADEGTRERVLAKMQTLGNLEPEAPGLPERLALGVDPGGVKVFDEGPGWWVALGCGYKEAVANGHPGKAWVKKVLQAAVDAYNREREEERLEAGHGALDEGLPRLLREKMEAEIDARAAEFVSSAEPVALTGAEDLPNPEPGPVREPFDPYEYDFSGPPTAGYGASAVTGAVPAEAAFVGPPTTGRSWPAELDVEWRDFGLRGDQPVLIPAGAGWAHRHQMAKAYEEAARRWKAEPQLRKRADVALDLIRRYPPGLQPQLHQLESILTGDIE